MEKLFETTMDALEWAALAASSAAAARRVAEVLHNAAQQSTEMTTEQRAQLKAKADEIFASPASMPSGR